MKPIMASGWVTGAWDGGGAERSLSPRVRWTMRAAAKAIDTNPAATTTPRFFRSPAKAFLALPHGGGHAIGPAREQARRGVVPAHVIFRRAEVVVVHGARQSVGQGSPSVRPRPRARDAGSDDRVRRRFQRGRRAVLPPKEPRS